MVITTMYKLTSCPKPYADPENFVRGGLTQIFLIYEGKKDPNTTKSRSSPAQQQNTFFLLVDPWLPTLNAGFVPLLSSMGSGQVLIKNPIAL